MKVKLNISLWGLSLWICVAALLATAPLVCVQGAANPVTNKDVSTQPATMRLKRYVITDDQGFKGIEVLHGLMPVDWTLKGGVTWKMALGIPNQIRIHWGRRPGCVRV